MVSIILSVFSVLVFAASAALCMWLGYRRGLFNSALRLVLFLLAGGIAFIVARCLVPTMGGTLLRSISLPDGMPSLNTLLKAVCGSLLAPLAFLVLFFVIDKLFLAIYLPLKKAFKDKEALHTTIPYDRVWGAVLGGVLALCITLSCVMPVSGYPFFLTDTTEEIASLETTEEILPEDLVSVVHEVTDNIVIKADYALSGWLFRALSSDAYDALASASNLLGVVKTLENSEDITAVSGALQQLPSESLDLLVAVAKDLIAPYIDNTGSTAKAAECFMLMLNKLPAMQKSLTPEEYAAEWDGVLALVQLVKTPPQKLSEDILGTVLSSRLVAQTVVENSETLAEAFASTVTKLSKGEKSELKSVIDSYAAKTETNAEVIAALYRILELS